MQCLRYIAGSLFFALCFISTASAHSSITFSNQGYNNYNNNRSSNRFSVVPQFSTNTYGPVGSFGGNYGKNYRRPSKKHYYNRYYNRGYGRSYGRGYNRNRQYNRYNNTYQRNKALLGFSQRNINNSTRSPYQSKNRNGLNVNNSTRSPYQSKNRNRLNRNSTTRNSYQRNIRSRQSFNNSRAIIIYHH